MTMKPSGIKTAVDLKIIDGDEIISVNDRARLKDIKKNYPNIDVVQVNLTPVFDSLIQTLPKVHNKEESFMSLANTRARLRMTSLYYFAALKKLLVTGTGNKVEDFGVGFYTKYGDGGVDISPIADLMKTEVFSLTETLGAIEAIQSEDAKIDIA